MKFLFLLILPLFAHAHFERDIPRIHAYDFVMSRQMSDDIIWRFGGDKNEKLYHRGFNINNYGPNHIITEPPVDFLNTPFRELYFQTDDMARRDTYLWVTDYNGSGKTSDFFESVFVFLPRLEPMKIEDGGENFVITLTTSEKVEIFKKYKTLDSKILTEEPVDLNPDRNLRKFPQIHYHGTGLVIRSDAKGRDPRLAKHVVVSKGDLPPCKLNGDVFWTQEGHPKFKFVHDEEAFQVIEKLCGPEYIP